MTLRCVPVSFGVGSCQCDLPLALCLRSTCLSIFYLYLPLSIDQCRTSFCSRWWSLSMLKEWRFATLSLWTRTASYEKLCGTPTTTPSCQIPTTGQVSASAPRLNKSRPYPLCALSFPLTSSSQLI